MATPVEIYASQGIVAFSVNISWDPSAKKGKGGKKSMHPSSWPTAGGFIDPGWNSVAINTELSRLVVVDFDDDDAFETFKRRASEAGINIATREAKSGSRVGGHLYFRTVEGDSPIKSTDNIAIFGMERGSSKVDVKAAGGLIYAPPSKYVMPDGTTREYVWANNLEFAPLPRGLYELLPKKDNPPTVRAARPQTSAAEVMSNEVRVDVVAPVPATEEAVGVIETIKLLNKLDDSRASGGRNSDWLRIGMALKRNEAILEKMGRCHEAKSMLTVFDVFSMRSPQYPGRGAIEKDWKGFKPGFDLPNATTMASVYHMAKQDVTPTDSVKALISSHLQCPVQNIDLRRENDWKLHVSSPNGDGYVDLTDLKLFLPNRKIDLAGPGGLQLCSKFVEYTKKYVRDLNEKNGLEYHRDNSDVALIKQKFSEGPVIKIMDPHSDDATFRYNYGGCNHVVPTGEIPEFNSILRSSLARACENALGADMYGQLVNYGTINNIVVKASVEADKTPTLMLGFQDTIFEFATENRLMKRNGIVYEPIAGLPCAYKPGPSYKDFLSKLFCSNKDIRSSSKHLGNLAEILTEHVHLKEFPEHDPNPCLLSYDNGVLDIVTMEFVPNEDVVRGHRLFGEASSHYIHGVYTGETDTPTLDKIFDYQGFTEETKRFVCGLMGRMLFPLKMLDGWEIILFVFGVPGTGKSLTLEVIENHFDPEVVGGFASKMDGHFPLEGFLGKRVVINKESEHNLLKSVNESDLKSMASGEGVTVNRKNKTALRVQKWEAHIALGSNFLPAFSKASKDALGRRIVPIKHSNIVLVRDTSLKSKLRDEMPNITAKILESYHSLRREIGNDDIVQHLPEQIKAWGGDIKSQTSKLYDFLAMPDEERVFEIDNKKYMVKFEKHQNEVVDKKKFGEIYRAMYDEKFVNDESAFHDFGFYSPETRTNCCLGCAKKHHAGCCESNKERRQRNVIVHMRMSTIFVESKSTSSVAENNLAKLIEDRFQVTLQRNVRPTWLRVPGKNSTLELDMYLPEKNLAIEYDGPQHYEYPNPFHNSREAFEHQQRLDRLKEKLCANKGVKLVRVRYDLQDQTGFLSPFFE